MSVMVKLKQEWTISRHNMVQHHLIFVSLLDGVIFYKCW